MLANSLIASASVGSVSSTGTSGSSEPSSSRSANCLPRALRSPTTIRDGWRLSWSARPSRRNSGLNTIGSPGVAASIRSVKPTGTVDLTTRVASGAAAWASARTRSTELVSK